MITSINWAGKIIRVILAGLLIFIQAPVFAEVYQYIDEDGNVAFTDKPSENAEKIEVPPVQAVSIPKAPSQQQHFPNYGRSTRYMPTANSYYPHINYQISLTSPENGDTIRNTGGIIEVSVTMLPELQPTHMVVVFVDGQALGSFDSAQNIQVAGVTRGTHQVHAKVIDSQEKVLGQSNEITIHYHQTSVMNRPIPIGAAQAPRQAAAAQPAAQ